MSKVVEFMLPKLRSVEGTITTFESSMDDELAQSIQNKLKERYAE